MVLTIGTFALWFAVAVPHCHADVDDSVASDPDDFCHACQLTDALSAVTPALPAIHESTGFLVAELIVLLDTPRTAYVVRGLTPRAPPDFSATSVISRVMS